MTRGGLHYRTCCLCEAMCGIVVEHRDGAVISIKPNRDDVLSRGHICPKAVALKDLHEDPDRLRTPLRRTPDGWEEISWSAAFDEIEARIGDIRARHGNDAVAIYAGNPTVHNLGAMLGVGDFIRALRTKNLYSATSVDQLPHMVASWALFGHQFLMPVPDVDRTQLFVCIGGNPVASAGSIMGAPGFEKRIEALRERGGRFIVVDPRRTESAAIADEHLSIRPGTDVFLLLALLHEVFSSGRESLGHLAPHAEGLDALREAVLRFDPVRLAERTGLPHERLVCLAQGLQTVDVRREVRQVDPSPLEHFVQQGKQQIDVGAGPDAEVFVGDGSGLCAPRIDDDEPPSPRAQRVDALLETGGAHDRACRRDGVAADADEQLRAIDVRHGHEELVPEQRP